MADESLDALKSKFRTLLELRETRDADKACAKRSEEAYREAEAELYQELEDAGVRGRLSFDFGPELGTASFMRRSTQYGRVLNKEEAVKYFRRAGLEDMLVQEKIAEGRLNEHVRDLLDSKKPLPEGIDFYDKKQISISRK